MRIWLVTVGEPLPVFDEGRPRLLRTGWLAAVLSGRGHEVTWWTSSFDHYAKRHRVDEDAVAEWHGGRLRVLRSFGYRRNTSPSRFLDHAVVARGFLAAARREEPPDLILASLPTVELAHAAVRYGSEVGTAVVVDVRDLWPDALVGLLPRLARPAGRLALAPLFARARAALRGSQGIVAVSDRYLDWALARADRQRQEGDGVFPLGYVRSDLGPAEEEAAGERLRKLGVREDAALCWYVGSFGRTYDLAPVLWAARELHARGRRDVQFVISGEGELRDRWHGRAEGLSNVVFTGWIGLGEIEWLRKHSAVGLQPYAPGAPQGLANKLFEYLSAGLPIVSSLAGENGALLTEHGCGLLYEPGSGPDCLERLLELLDNGALRRAMGQRALETFERHFDGITVLNDLSAHLEAVVECKQGTSGRPSGNH